jgi:hypothetical protein
MSYSVILMDSFLEPPDPDECRCSGIEKELGYCECFLDAELEIDESEEELVDAA